MTPVSRAAALPPEERRQALIAATLPLVLEHGTGVSTRLIAEAAGVAEGTIFRVFATKDELIEAVLTSAFDPSPLVEGIGELDRALPLADRLVAAVVLMQERGRRVAGLLHAFAARGSLPHRERSWRIGAADTRVVDALALLIEPDREQFRYPPTEVARRLRLMTLAFSNPRLVENHPLPPEEIVSMLLDGVRTHPSTAASAPDPSTIGASSC